MITAIYPGTFDPITKGHLDIIRRASPLVGRLIVAIATNAGKSPIFTLEERLAMVQQEVDTSLSSLQGSDALIEVKAFGNLLVDFARDHQARLIVRGLRAVSDFDYEFQMAHLNKAMNATIETVFLVASESNQFISSTYIKEIAVLGGDVRAFVSEAVAQKLLSKIHTSSKGTSMAEN